MTQENKTLADFLESERNEFNNICPKLVEKANIVEYISGHDTRLLAFVREWAKENQSTDEWGSDNPHIFANDLLEFLTQQEPIITTQKPPIEVLEEAVKDGTFSSLTPPTKV